LAVNAHEAATTGPSCRVPVLVVLSVFFFFLKLQ
jgi:hypothetical protein